MDYQEFKDEMWSAMYTIKNNFSKIVEPMLASENLNIMQAGILFCLHDKKSMNVGSLCKEFSLNQGNVSTMCKNMEKLGLINRSRTSEDERIVTVSLTDEGNAVIERLKNRSNIFDDILMRMPPEKLQTIVDGVRGLCEFVSMI